MKIFWTEEAKIELKQTLMYWTIHNMSDSYSKKIDVETVEAYKRVFFKSRFVLYYQVDEENKTIYIIHFRSCSQKPL